MKVEIKIPSVGESITEATIGTILKPTGSQVTADEELLEIETEKLNQVLYVPQAGTVNLNVSTGDTVKIGQVIGYIDTEAKEPAKTTPPKEKPAPPKAEEKKSVAPPPPAPPVPEPVRAPQAAVPASAEPGVRISKEEFLADLSTPLSAAAEKAAISFSGERRETRKKMSKIRQVIAQRLLDAQHSTAMLTTFNEVDMTEVIAIRERYKETFPKTYGVRLGFMSFFVTAVVDALKSFPGLNSYIDGDEVVHREYYDISIAVSTERGLVVPNVRNCDQLSFDQIEKEIENYAKKAREGGLTIDDLKGGSFTITNGGLYGSLLSTPILNPPQSGILGMHRIVKRPIALNDQVVIRPMMYLALSYDHRIVDGKEAVSFLVAIKNYLEDPARMLIHI